MSNYDPTLIAEYAADIRQNNKSIAQKAEELGIPRSTLYSVLHRFEKKTKQPRRSVGRPKVTVINLKDTGETKVKSLGDLLNEISINVDAIKKVLGLK